MKYVLDALRDIYRKVGFNLIGVASAEEYDAKAPPGAPRLREVLPEASTVFLVGNGGSAFWSHYKAFLRENPEFERGRADPFDDYTALVLSEGEKLLRGAGFNTRSIYPFVREKVWFSFQHMAVLAGLGQIGKHGVLIHPEYGPWISFRGALLTDIPFSLLTGSGAPFGPSNRDFDPCTGCPAPCMTACPGSAVTTTGFHLSRCVETKLVHAACRWTCLARFHCVYGVQHRFHEAELKLHARFTPEHAREVSSHLSKSKPD